MIGPTTVTPEQLGDKFADVLREWLTEGEFNLMRVLNKNEKDPQICHSHDFCDANMAMLEAFTEYEIGAQYEPACEADNILWNAAWAYAKVKYLGAMAK